MVGDADAVIAVPDSSDSIVIADVENRAIKYAHLIRLSPIGSVLWSVPPPGGSGDSFVSAKLDGRAIVARSWRGFQVRVAIDTGEVVESTFTK